MSSKRQRTPLQSAFRLWFFSPLVQVAAYQHLPSPIPIVHYLLTDCSKIHKSSWHEITLGFFRGKLLQRRIDGCQLETALHNMEAVKMLSLEVEGLSLVLCHKFLPLNRLPDSNKCKHSSELNGHTWLAHRQNNYTTQPSRLKAHFFSCLCETLDLSRISCDQVFFSYDSWNHFKIMYKQLGLTRDFQHLIFQQLQIFINMCTKDGATL